MDTSDDGGNIENQGSVVHLAKHIGHAHVPPQLSSQERVKQVGKPETSDLAGYSGSQKTLGITREKLS
jgi:hypothetical protein